MSAYICDDSVFATLGCFAALTINDMDAFEAAAVLAAENYRSVNTRYREDNTPPPVDMSTALAVATRAQLLEIIAEYDYQACENSDYPETKAGLLVQLLRSNAVAFVPNDKSQFADDSMVGKAVYDRRNGKRGYVVSERVATEKTYTLGAEGLQKNSPLVLTVAWLPSSKDGVLSMSDRNMNTLLSELESDYNWPPITPRQAQALFDDYEKEQAVFAAKARRAREAQEEERRRFESELKEVMPADCKGVIVAELLSDESDIYTGYFGGSVQKTVILGFSSHTRALFPEMRKACRLADLEDLPELALLADAESSEERRKKCSMYYIEAKCAATYSGWKIKKVSALKGKALGISDVPSGELRLPKQTGKPRGPKNSTVVEEQAVPVLRCVIMRQSKV